MDILVTYENGETSEEFLTTNDIWVGKGVKDIKVLRHGHNLLHEFRGDYYCLDKVKLAHTDYVLNKDKNPDSVAG